VRGDNGSQRGRDGLRDPDGAYRDGENRSGIAAIQRSRLISAIAELTSEHGVSQVTVAHIVERAGVSRRTFYELFPDCEACFIAAFEEAIRRAALGVLPAFDAGGTWQERVRAGLGAALEFLDEEPGLGGLCVVEALGAGPAALQCRTRVIEILVDAIDEGRAEYKGSLPPTRLTAEGIVGAVLAVLHTRIASGERQAMIELRGALMGMIVLPYRGARVAGRELSRPEAKREPVTRREGDPLRGIGMRITYRTVRVLGAVASNPGSSNRLVAEASGIADQGQISKLLLRLAHRGLIHNHGAGSAQGEPNAWSLTPRGEQIEQAIRRQTTPTGT
jgi:AcrR family transcriptional regulator